MILQTIYHQPILLPEIIAALKIRPGNKYIDATIGGGGYTREIIKFGGQVLGIDRDLSAQQYLKKNLAAEIESRKLILAHDNFSKVAEIAKINNFIPVNGVIFDLGVSTFQLTYSGRGFSFKRDEFLDMRMNEDQTLRAYDIVNNYSAEKLYEIFTAFSEELNSRTIADAIVRARSLEGPVTTTAQLSKIITLAMQKIYKGQSQNFIFEKQCKKTLTRIYQGIRIAVNGELDSLVQALNQVFDIVVSGGVVIVLSYHSLEDRIVKLTFQRLKRDRIIKIVNKNLIRANKEEVIHNPKAEVAKLRIAEKS